MRGKIQVNLTPSFGRDYGRMLRQQRVTADEVMAAADYFASGTKLPPEWQDHALRGRWAGCREFHLSGAKNSLIIYRRRGLAIEFIAMGGHEDLFPPKPVTPGRLEQAIKIRAARQEREQRERPRRNDFIDKLWDWLK
jgi:mRNA interferase YafQ